MAYYAIDDADGTELCSGLSEDESYAAAQRWADRLGASVYLYEVGSDEEPEEIEPA